MYRLLNMSRTPFIYLRYLFLALLSLQLNLWLTSSVRNTDGLCFTIWMYLYLLDKIEARTVSLIKKKLCRCPSISTLTPFSISLLRVRSLLPIPVSLVFHFVYGIKWNRTGLALMGKELGCTLSRVGNWLNRSPLCCLSCTHKSPRENRERCLYCELRTRFAEWGEEGRMWRWRFKMKNGNISLSRGSIL